MLLHDRGTKAWQLSSHFYAAIIEIGTSDDLRESCCWACHIVSCDAVR